MNTVRERPSNAVSHLSSVASLFARAAAMLAGLVVVLTVAAVGLAVMTAVAVGMLLSPGLPRKFRWSATPGRDTSGLLERARTDVRSRPAAVDER